MLFRDLSLLLDGSGERVAITGRNGVGKSSLLSVLAGQLSPANGNVHFTHAPMLVPQTLTGASDAAKSRGERRKAALEQAFGSHSPFLLLDEPTSDLDEDGVAWILHQLATFKGTVVAVSHDPRLLETFSNFLVLEEAGGRLFSGSFDGLEADMLARYRRAERDYFGGLQRLAGEEKRAAHLRRRKARKRRYGRCSELDRATPRIRLNQKRSQAQESHGRITALREARMEALREGARAGRRALSNPLPLMRTVPKPGNGVGPAIDGRGLSAIAGGPPYRASGTATGGRLLFENLNLRVTRERIAVTGPNGAGKSTLLSILLGEMRPAGGTVRCDRDRVGALATRPDESPNAVSLSTRLQRFLSPDEVMGHLASHRFPFALALRPLASLSPGERIRALLIDLLAGSMTRFGAKLEVIVLDEPTADLDLFGRRALLDALVAWEGGLVVASHDRPFLNALGIHREIVLGGD